MRNKFVLLPFSFDDLSTTKIRVGLCLTDPIGPYQHVVVAFVTTQIPITPLETDVIMDSSDAEFAVTGLKASSAIRLHRLVTVSKSVIHRQLGKLPADKQQTVADGLRGLFKLAYRAS